MKNLLFAWISLFSFSFAALPLFAANETPPTEAEIEKLKEQYAAHVQKIEQSIQYKTGANQVGSNLATITVGDKFRFLNAADAKKVLVDLWGNPSAEDVLGMIVPADVKPSEENGWGAVITFDDDGYVSDKDADSINYTELLAEMKKGEEATNKLREKEGYEAVHIVGWAAPPRYDKSGHLLYWAKELSFGHSPENTLNYNVRLLGRKGVLNINIVAAMDQLAQIETTVPEILGSAQFNEGNRYADFNSKTDKVAEYGIAALVMGGAAAVAAKGGIFKGLIALAIAGKKLIVIGAIAIAAFFGKLFGKKQA